jgi:type I restriction enzyme M protein
MLGNYTEIGKRVWDAADELRANSKLKSSESSVPVMGLTWLRYATKGENDRDNSRCNTPPPLRSVSDSPKTEY